MKSTNLPKKTLSDDQGPANAWFQNSIRRVTRSQAIAGLVEGLNDGLARQTLLGVTGSGKTYTIANVIQENVQRPAIVLAPNKTLAAQLVRRNARVFSTRNSVEYFRLLL